MGDVDLPEIWAACVEMPLDDDTREGIDDHRLASSLRSWSPPLLLEAGRLARKEQGGRFLLPLKDWLDGCVELADIHAALRRRPPAFLQAGAPELLDREVCLVLHSRLVEKSFSRQPRRRRQRTPVGCIPGLEQADADAVEVAVALRVASTAPDGQFLSTGLGTAFVGSRHGYHRLDDRGPEIMGLSAALDDVVEAFDLHRRGGLLPGGRFYIGPDGGVECAACKRVISKVGAQRDCTLPVPRCQS